MLDKVCYKEETVSPPTEPVSQFWQWRCVCVWGGAGAEKACMCIWYLERATPALSLTSWQTMESKVPFFLEILSWETSAKEPTEAFRDRLHEDCAKHCFWNLNRVRAGHVLKSCGFEVLTPCKAYICPSHGRNSTHLPVLQFALWLGSWGSLSSASHLNGGRDFRSWRRDGQCKRHCLRRPLSLPHAKTLGDFSSHLASSSIWFLESNSLQTASEVWSEGPSCTHLKPSLRPTDRLELEWL